MLKSDGSSDVARAPSFSGKGVDFVPRDMVYWCSVNAMVRPAVSTSDVHIPEVAARGRVGEKAIRERCVIEARAYSRSAWPERSKPINSAARGIRAGVHSLAESRVTDPRHVPLFACVVP